MAEKYKELVRKLYAAINSDNLPAAMERFHPEIVRIEPDDFPTPGTYRGLAEMEGHILKGRATWAEGSCEPEELVVVGDKIVALVHVKVRLKGREDWIDGRLGDVFAFKDGKILLMRTFGEQKEALDWAKVNSGT